MNKGCNVMYRTTSTLFVRQGRKRGDIWPSALSGGYINKKFG